MEIVWSGCFWDAVMTWSVDVKRWRCEVGCDCLLLSSHKIFGETEPMLGLNYLQWVDAWPTKWWPKSPQSRVVMMSKGWRDDLIFCKPSHQFDELRIPARGTHKHRPFSLVYRLLRMMLAERRVRPYMTISFKKWKLWVLQLPWACTFRPSQLNAKQMMSEPAAQVTNAGLLKEQNSGGHFLSTSQISTWMNHDMRNTKTRPSAQNLSPESPWCSNTDALRT